MARRPGETEADYTQRILTAREHTIKEELKKRLGGFENNDIRTRGFVRYLLDKTDSFAWANARPGSIGKLLDSDSTAIQLDRTVGRNNIATYVQYGMTEEYVDVAREHILEFYENYDKRNQQEAFNEIGLEVPTVQIAEP